MTIHAQGAGTAGRMRAAAACAALVTVIAACGRSAPATADSAAPATHSAQGAASVAASPASNSAVGEPTLVVYKTPTCGCCKGWVSAMEKSGFKVEVHDLPDLASIKHAAGVPDSLQACHTARIGGYVVEGHVPAADIRRLLAERPDIAGISAPGMPMGSPGMEGAYADHYDVMTFGGNARSTVFASH
jgi:hypothetical protein